MHLAAALLDTLPDLRQLLSGVGGFSTGLLYTLLGVKSDFLNFDVDVQAQLSQVVLD